MSLETFTKWALDHAQTTTDSFVADDGRRVNVTTKQKHGFLKKGMKALRDELKERYGLQQFVYLKQDEYHTILIELGGKNRSDYNRFIVTEKKYEIEG